MNSYLTPSQEVRLQNLAAHAERSPQEIAQEGMERFLAYEEEALAALRKSEEDVRAGRVMEHDVVVARIERLLQQ